MTFYFAAHFVYTLKVHLSARLMSLSLLKSDPFIIERSSDTVIFLSDSIARLNERAG